MKNTLIRILAILSLAACTLTAAAATPVSYTELPAISATALNQQRAYVSTLLAQHFPGTVLKKNEADFEALQRIIDKKLIRKDQAWELEALGVCYGDALTSYIPGLHWVQVTDEFGTDPVLRYKDLEATVSAQSHILKRIEKGEEVNVRFLADGVKRIMAENIQKWKGKESVGKSK